jgi:hypothetical protein
MSLDTLVILVLVVASIFGLVALERHSRKNQSRDKANSGEGAPEKKPVD